MATKFKEGDRVQVADRAVTAEDSKSGLYFSHFRGLTGTILKVYGEEASVEVELESLAEPVAHRHLDVQEQMKTRWLDGLSEEARNRLSEPEKDFRLRYTILVSLNDLVVPTKKAAPAPAVAASSEATTQEARRRTSADIAADEEAYLRSRKNGQS